MGVRIDGESRAFTAGVVPGGEPWPALVADAVVEGAVRDADDAVADVARAGRRWRQRLARRRQRAAARGRGASPAATAEGPVACEASTAVPLVVEWGGQETII